MSEGNEGQSTGAPEITADAIRRRRFNKEVNNRLQANTILRELHRYKKGKVAVDVGAATGHITYYLKDHYDEVYAYEAVPHVARELAKMEQFDNVRTFCKAVSSFDGEETFHVDHLRLSNSSFQDLVGGPEITVSVVQLDTDLEGVSEIGFIKIDVEGTEFDVLRGAQKIIERDRPNLMVEIYEPYSFYPLGAIFDLLMRQKYKCAFFSPKEDGMVTVASVEDGVRAVRERHAEHDGDFLFYGDG